MFTIYDKLSQTFPIKVWLEDETQIEESCFKQAINLSNLPFLHKHVVLMPDTHAGKGMPIGGVIATKDVIIPSAVGVDIGCGMAFVQTNIPADFLKEGASYNLLQEIITDILEGIPTGFKHHKNKQKCATLDNIKSYEDYNFAKELLVEIKNGYYQVGTLGGGNHFIELQEDENGILCIMLHSGSRNFGYKICTYFEEVAKELNQRMDTKVPKEYNLPFLPIETKEGQAYLNWMNLALDFAKENRQKMLDKVINIVYKRINKHFRNIEFKEQINAHHNYAAFEHHYGEDVWVHRKGAIRAKKEELGIIPGAMGSYSYIVEGLGNAESFYSCSHGAGRIMSRTKAKKSMPVQDVLTDLDKRGVVLGKKKTNDVAEESPLAYKDINEVINNELDLVKPIKKLKTLGVVKG